MTQTKSISLKYICIPVISITSHYILNYLFEKSILSTCPKNKLHHQYNSTTNDQNIFLIMLQNVMRYLFFRPYLITNKKVSMYRYLFEIIIADNICEQKYVRCAHIKKLRSTFTQFTKVEMLIQVLSYFASIVILSDLRLEKILPQWNPCPCYLTVVFLQ